MLSLISLKLNDSSLAIHTTCYEQSTKVMGLKAANGFWNPRYYDPLRRTLTKPLLFLDESQLLDEVRTLLWLGMVTNRSVIIPNLLGAEAWMAKQVVEGYAGRAFWPGFRVVKLKKVKGMNVLRVDILEPAFYWRVGRDYSSVPDPSVLLIDRPLLSPSLPPLSSPSASSSFSTESSSSLLSLLHALLLLDASPRVVISGESPSSEDSIDPLIRRVRAWAEDSVGHFERPFTQERPVYKPLPSLKSFSFSPPSVSTLLFNSISQSLTSQSTSSSSSSSSQSFFSSAPEPQDGWREWVLGLRSEALQGMRLCEGIFSPPKGNRSCFQVCE